MQQSTDLRRADVSYTEFERVPGQPLLDLGLFDLQGVGYVAEEFFLGGEADHFVGDGSAEYAVKRAGTGRFRTRCVIVRPIDRARFNGTVVVEWLNVTMGRDLAADWGLVHREIFRRGAAYVGVSAQVIGVEGGFSLLNDMPLKAADPSRYASLVHPGDEYAYSIFSCAGKALREQANSVFGRSAERLIAVGASQSASFLITYVNTVDPLHRVYDGYIVHGCSAGSAPLDGQFLVNMSTTPLHPTPVRRDVRVPVMTVVAETDVLGIRIALTPGSEHYFTGYFFARQADSERFRAWEVAGSSHATGYGFNVAPIDSGLSSIEALARAYRPLCTVVGAALTKPLNPDPQQHYVLETALWSLDRWIRTGRAPASASPLEITGSPRMDERPQLVLDDLGNACGGVRTPWMDVPTAVMSGTGNGGAPIASLAGRFESFEQARLDSLYPGGQADYIEKFKHSLDAAIGAGYLLPDHKTEIELLAAAMYGAPNSEE